MGRLQDLMGRITQIPGMCGGRHLSQAPTGRRSKPTTVQFAGSKSIDLCGIKGARGFLCHASVNKQFRLVRFHAQFNLAQFSNPDRLEANA